MALSLKLFVLSLTINFCMSFKADDLCWVNIKQDGRSIKCEGKYWNQCGQEHCSVDKVSCKVFLIFNALLNLYLQKISLFQNFLYSAFILKSMKLFKLPKEKLESLKGFFENIKMCPKSIESVSNEWKQSQVCILNTSIICAYAYF